MEAKQKILKFNTTYVEMQTNLKQILKVDFEIQKISRTREITLFVNQMDKNMELYKNMDTKLFEKVLCLYKVFGKGIELAKKNKEIVWKYLNLLHTIATNKKQEEIKQAEPFDLTKMSGLVNNLMNDESNGFKDIVASISEKLESTLNDENVNQAEVLQDLMSGKLESNGINFNEIIQAATSTLKEKIASGSVNTDNLKEIAEKIKENIQL